MYTLKIEFSNCPDKCLDKCDWWDKLISIFSQNLYTSEMFTFSVVPYFPHLIQVRSLLHWKCRFSKLILCYKSRKFRRQVNFVNHEKLIAYSFSYMKIRHTRHHVTYFTFMWGRGTGLSISVSSSFGLERNQKNRLGSWISSLQTLHCCANQDTRNMFDDSCMLQSGVIGSSLMTELEAIYKIFLLMKHQDAEITNMFAYKNILIYSASESMMNTSHRKSCLGHWS